MQGRCERVVVTDTGGIGLYQDVSDVDGDDMLGDACRRHAQLHRRRQLLKNNILGVTETDFVTIHHRPVAPGDPAPAILTKP